MIAADASQRPWPPFGDEVQAELAKGRRPSVKLFCGRDARLLADIWRKECGPGSALMLLDDADPASFRWPAGVELTALYCSQSTRAVSRRLALVAALIRDGVRFTLIGDGRTILRRGMAVTP